MKTKVKFISNDPHGDYFAGDYGYIDGYVCNDSGAFAVVVITTSVNMNSWGKENSIVLADLDHMEALGLKTQ